MAVAEATEPIERWTAKRRVALIVSLLKGEISVAEAALWHGLTGSEIEDWREKVLLGAENTLRSLSKDEEAIKDEQIKNSHGRSAMWFTITIGYGRP